MCWSDTYEDLDLLLASPSLEEFILILIDLPIDDYFRRATNFNKFLSLQRLKFNLMDHVTKAGIDLLMNDDNPIKVIEHVRCQSLNVGDIEEWTISKNSELFLRS